MKLSGATSHFTHDFQCTHKAYSSFYDFEPIKLYYYLLYTHHQHQSVQQQTVTDIFLQTFKYRRPRMHI